MRRLRCWLRRTFGVRAIYLAGPINGCTDEQAKGWRETAAVLFVMDGWAILDPMARDYRGKENEAVNEIVEGDKADIDACDGVLVWFERPSVGTSMEVLYAWERGIPVVVVNRSGKPASPWLTYHARAVCSSASEALAALNEAPNTLLSHTAPHDVS